MAAFDTNRELPGPLHYIGYASRKTAENIFHASIITRKQVSAHRPNRQSDTRHFGQVILNSARKHGTMTEVPPKIRVIITGATGMVGEDVMLEECIVPHFLDLDGDEACFCCAGVIYDTTFTTPRFILPAGW